MKQLAKAVIQVMKEVKGMEKNTKVGSGNYAYNGTKDQDVKEVFNDAMSRNGLCMIPTNIEDETQIDRWEESGRQKQSVFTKVKVKYLLLHESGESIEVAGYGHGIDNQDKGAGKATTYAMKNALLYTFCTPVGKIDDTGTTHSNDVATPAVKPQQKPFLNASHPNWNKCVEYLKKEGSKIEDLNAKYRITKGTIDELNKLVK